MSLKCHTSVIFSIYLPLKESIKWHYKWKNTQLVLRNRQLVLRNRQLVLRNTLVLRTRYLENLTSVSLLFFQSTCSNGFWFLLFYLAVCQFKPRLHYSKKCWSWTIYTRYMKIKWTTGLIFMIGRNFNKMFFEV